MWRFLKPLVGELIELHAGLRFQTASTLAAGISEGRLVRVRMLCFLGDWVERTKIGGLPAHGAACPCSWCMITSSPKAQVRSLSEPYPPRDAAAHCEASLAARELPSNAARN